MTASSPLPPVPGNGAPALPSPAPTPPAPASPLRHEQVAAWLREQMDACALAPGRRLPTEHELCERFGVSRITVRHALQTLAAEGRIVRRQGAGSFVRAPRVPAGLVHLTTFAEDAARAGLVGTSRVLGRADERASAELAGMLGMAEAAPVVRLDRLRLADGAPVAFDRTWMPMDVSARLDGHDLAAETLFAVLDRHGLPVTSGLLRLDATAADAEAAQVLGVPLGTPLLRVLRTARTRGERTVFVQCRQYRADRAAFDLTLARDPDAAEALPHGTLPMRTLQPVLLPER